MKTRFSLKYYSFQLGSFFSWLLLCVYTFHRKTPEDHTKKHNCVFITALSKDNFSLVNITIFGYFKESQALTLF